MTVTGLFQPPFTLVLAVLLSFLAVLFGSNGLRLFRLGLRSGSAWSGPLNIVKGIRSGIVAVIMVGWAACFFLEQTSALVIGAVILGEEIYETGVLILIVRFGQRMA
jgi:hypothetical protein